jgi:hypothetical protein
MSFRPVFIAVVVAFALIVSAFVFSLTDHAMNGFFNAVEWTPVVSSACAIGALPVPFMMDVDRPYLRLCAAALGVQALVGVAGFAFHVASDLRQPGASLFERILSGAPPMAPLLFPNLVVLGWIALWLMAPHVRQQEQIVRP